MGWRGIYRSPSGHSSDCSRLSERVSMTRIAPSVLPSCSAICLDGRPSTYRRRRASR